VKQGDLIFTEDVAARRDEEHGRFAQELRSIPAKAAKDINPKDQARIQGKAAHRYKAAVLGVLYQEMTGDWENMTDRLHRAATLSITRRINADRQNIEAKMLRKQAKRFVDRCYLSGAWVPPSAAPQREWYRHDWRWPAARYQNLFQDMNAFKLATENSFMDDDTAVAELFGLDPRKVDRAQAVSKARKAALQSGPAADIIRAEVEKDELAVTEAFAKSDDDAVGLRRPMKRPSSRRS
jgi:capsid protein